MSELRKLREQTDISQAELARRSGVHPVHISEFENGRVQPWPKARRALAEALGVTEDDIWPRDGDDDGDT